jgi:hypothetical protein
MPEPDRGRNRYLPSVALAAFMLGAIVVYLPGLGSGLYLDDYYNLYLLERVRDEGILAFAGSGVAGPLGRPLSYLSFALQAGSWPSDIAAFKRVNLLIHLGNGLLVFFIWRALYPFLELPRGMREVFGVFAAGLWLFHPMHLSTVLYVVQRMTELSALFMLLGIRGYLAGRKALEDGKPRAGFMIMTAAIVAGGLAATLSKENGILLPVLVLLLDSTLLRSRPRPAGYRRWRLLFLVLPTVAIGIWLIWQAWGFQHTFQWRPYSMYQKFLTENGILLLYLWGLLVPRPSAFGMFHDDFPVATSILAPAWVPAALAANMVLVGGALLMRRRHPVPVFCVLWFFAGHVLESTHLNLEIYFEHRNYLPSAGFLALVPWVVCRYVPPSRSNLPAIAGLLLYMLLIAGVSLQNSLLWRRPLAFAEEAVRVHPQSRWAKAQLGSRYIGAGKVDKAQALYREMAGRYPTAILPALRLAAITGCIRNEPVPDEDWGRLRMLAESGSNAGLDFLAELDTQVSVVTGGDCDRGYAPRLTAVVEDMTRNPNLRRELGALHQLAGALRLTLGDIAAGVEHYRLAKETGPTLNRRWVYIDLLLRLRNRDAARDELDAFRDALKREPVAWLAYGDKLAAAEKLLDTMTDRNPEPP